MRILMALPLTALLLIISCKPRGALTPREAFYQLRYAYESSDPEIMENLLSSKSRLKIREVISAFASMGGEQSRSVSKRFGINEEKVRNMTVRDYLLIHFNMERKREYLSDSVKHRIVSVERKKKRAVIKVENGMDLNFVKEGPYWKFEMSEY